MNKFLIVLVIGINLLAIDVNALAQQPVAHKAHEELIFANSITGRGYKIFGDKILSVKGSRDVFGKQVWLTDINDTIYNAIVFKADHNFFEVTSNSGVVVEHIDDSGTIYYWHAEFHISADRTQVIEKSKYAMFWPANKAPSFEEWLKEDFQKTQVYEVIK